MNRVLLLAAVCCCYMLVLVAALLIHVEYGNAFDFVHEAANAKEQAYLTAGRLLVFLNLWAAVFYINAGLGRAEALLGGDIAMPAVSSTITAALIYLCAPYIFTYGGPYLAASTGWFF